MAIGAIKKLAPVAKSIKSSLSLRNWNPSGKATKNIFGNTGTSAQEKIMKGHNDYLRSIGALKKKADVSDIIESYKPSHLDALIDSVGYHKVAATMHPEYGKAEDLDLFKAIGVLGSKLAHIKRENNLILSGLQGLKEI